MRSASSDNGPKVVRNSPKVAVCLIAISAAPQLPCGKRGCERLRVMAIPLGPCIAGGGKVLRHEVEHVRWRGLVARGLVPWGPGEDGLKKIF